MFLARAKLTILQIFLYVFGFTSVTGPCERHRLVPERLAFCSWGKYRHLALGAFALGWAAVVPLPPLPYAGSPDFVESQLWEPM